MIREVGMGGKQILDNSLCLFDRIRKNTLLGHCGFGTILHDLICSTTATSPGVRDLKVEDKGIHRRTARV
jgi:hypothetical protein